MKLALPKAKSEELVERDWAHAVGQSDPARVYKRAADALLSHGKLEEALKDPAVYPPVPL